MDRYPLAMAREILTSHYGRRFAAKILLDARLKGAVVIGATRVGYADGSYSIADV